MGTRVILLAAALFLSGTDATAKSLHWSRFDVEARLDVEGRLHVVERQAIVFDGDWNGGERNFDLRPGQKLDLHAIRRIDRTGSVIDLKKGDLDDVDHYDRIDRKTLRWRSRLPSDPPFRNRRIIYELDYTLSNVLIGGSDDGYILDHDFAFSDREGVIEQFALDLELDPEWEPLSGYRGHWTAASLAPGRGFVVTIPLRYGGTTPPKGVYRGASNRTRSIALILLMFVTATMLGAYFRHEIRRGRFARLTPLAEIDERWLEAHLLPTPPELAGAAWDDRVGAPEVAGLIARLVAEGKLKSWTESKGWGPFRKHVLHLELLVPRESFKGHEASLIRAIFDVKSTYTNTEQIRESYSSRGFDPAAKIRKPLLRAASRLGRAARRGVKRNEDSPVVGALVLAFLVSAALIVTGIIESTVNVKASLIGGIGLLVLFAPAAAFAFQSRNRVHRVITSSAILVTLVGGMVALATFSIRSFESAGVYTLFGIVFLAILLCGISLRLAITTETLESIAARKRLASARRYFVRELRRPRPRLRDSWFPYALAFGLGSGVDRWFRAFGGASHDSDWTIDSTNPGGSASGWTGGGGAFGGAGATASWSAAVGSFASGVPAPSSSGSSGGGSSSGGSSGGGGGGGW